MKNSVTIRGIGSAGRWVGRKTGFGVFAVSAALLAVGLPVLAQNAKPAGTVLSNLGIPAAPLNFGKQTAQTPKPLKLPNAKTIAPKSDAKNAAKISQPSTEVQPVPAKPNPALAQTKPDLAPAPPTAGTTKFNTLDSPTAAIGDSGRMIFFLVPMLLVTYGALKLLQRYQQKTGRLPAALQNAAKTQQTQKPAKSGGIIAAILGSFQLNNARERGGSSIRVVESVPIGGVNIHLVEVRGRLLLLGGSGGSVNLLTEFQETEIDGSDFRALLNAAAAEMDGLSEYDTIPTSAVVGGIEDDLRGTGEAMQKRLRRLRTVQEAETNPDFMRFDDAR